MSGQHRERDRCGAKRRDGQPCGLPAIPDGWVCRRHGGAAPQVAIAAEYQEKQLQLYAAEVEFKEARGTPREFGALCRALQARRDLKAYEIKLVRYYDLRDALRERRAAASRSAPGPEPAPVIPPDPVAVRKAARDKAFRARQHKL
jgi:hypothetical protein